MRKLISEKKNTRRKQNRLVPLGSGCVLWLSDLQKSAAQWSDLSGYNNHSAVNGAALATLGYTFDGVDDYIDSGIASSVDAILSEVTIQGWVKLSSYPEVPFYTGLLRRERKFLLMIRPNGEVHPYVWVMPLDAWKNSNGGGILALNTWYNIALTYNGLTIKSYINGSLNNSVNYTGTIGSGLTATRKNTDIGAGWGLNTGYFINGAIGEVQIYNRALSAAEIESMFQLTRATYGV